MAEEQQHGTFSSAIRPSGYKAGQRSITDRSGITRFEMMRQRERAALKNRPFMIAALVFVLAVMLIPAWAYYQTYVKPPQEVAVQVADKIYTRGDVVDFIRFNQRLSEDLGVPFELGTSVFEALQTLQSQEISYHLAPRYGITVEQDEVDERLEDLLGFFAENSIETDPQEYRANVEEAKRQFLNRVGLREEVYRDFIRKTMFKERLRTEVASNISRIQPQVEVYQIVLYDRDRSIMNQLERQLKSGRSVDDIVQDFSQDPNVKSNRGYLGWIPQGARPDLDYLLYGRNRNEDGTPGDRVLPLRTLSTGNYDETSQTWTGHIVAQYSEAREVSDGHFEALSDQAIEKFINEHREDFYTSVTMDSEIYDWVNQQVRIAAIVPTPTPMSPFASVQDLDASIGAR